MTGFTLPTRVGRQNHPFRPKPMQSRPNLRLSVIPFFLQRAGGRELAPLEERPKTWHLLTFQLEGN